KNVFSVTHLQDAIRADEVLESIHRVSIIRAGYVELELAECLHRRGKQVHLFERETQVLSSVDRDMAQIIEYELQRFGVKLSVGARVLALTGHEGRVNGVKAASGIGIEPSEVVLLDTGVEPYVDMARNAGTQIGLTGAIAVNRSMETSVPAM